VVTAPIQLGGDRRIIRIAYLFSVRSISAGVFDWLKIRLAWIRFPERGPGDCNGQWDGDFTWLTLLGSQRLHFEVLDKYEAVIVGGIFCLLGVVIILFEK
jgi:hypothetical protein